MAFNGGQGLYRFVDKGRYAAVVQYVFNNISQECSRYVLFLMQPEDQVGYLPFLHDAGNGVGDAQVVAEQSFQPRVGGRGGIDGGL